MSKDFRIKPHFFEVGSKALLYGEKTLRFAQVIDKTSLKYNLDVIVILQDTDINPLANNT